MRIGIDIRPLQGHSGFRGIGRYLENILTHLPTSLADEEFVFYADKRMKFPTEKLQHLKNQRTIWVRPKRISRVKYLRAFARPYTKVRPRKKDIDVLFQAEAAYGISKSVPTVGVFMDIIPLLFKFDDTSMNLSGIMKYKQKVARIVHNKFYKEILDSFKTTAAIVAISQSSKDDFIKYLDKEMGKRIVVTPLAVAHTLGSELSNNNSVLTLKKYGLLDGDYLLYVGAIDQRKNIAGLAKDYFELKKAFPKLKLVCAGKEFGLGKNLRLVGWSQILDAHPIEKKDIVIPGYLSDDELTVLYKHAVCFVFPSRYEGFGLPVLEAMTLGCPAVCYDNSSLPEVVGSAALIVKDGESMVPSIKKLLNDKGLRDRLIERGVAQAKRFSWKKTAQTTFEVIVDASKKN